MNELEEIKSKLDIAEVIGGYIPMKRAGRNFKACCPFHSEKTPSFMVSVEKQIWHCFGCNEGGDVFGFVMKMEGLDFYSTLKLLADKTGVRLKENPKDFTEDKDKKNKLFAINEFAADYYEKKLQSSEGKKALDYLKKRGLTEKTIEEFRLGYAPKSEKNLLDELLKIGFSEADVVRAGLAKKRDEKVLDYFWDRIIFPIDDHSGCVVGFSARTLREEIQPKYLNTPETDIYHKSNIFYGLDKAKNDIRKSDHAILVEGNMDVIASHQAGIKNTVATSGTALTETQLRLLKRFTNNLKLAFDIDLAGDQATKRAIEMAQNQGFNIKIIEIPEGKDPAEVVSKDKKIWINSCKNAKYVVDYIFDKCLNNNNMETVLGKKAIARELLGVIKKLPDKIEQDHYLKRLSRELDVEVKTLKEALEKVTVLKTTTILKQDVKEPLPKNIDISSVLEERIVILPIIHSEYRNYVTRNLKESFIKDDLFREIFLKLSDSKNKNVRQKLSKEAKEKLDILELKIENEFSGFSKENLGEEIFFCLKRLKEIRLREERNELIKNLSSLETKSSKNEVSDMIKKLDKAIKDQEN